MSKKLDEASTAFDAARHAFNKACERYVEASQDLDSDHGEERRQMFDAFGVLNRAGIDWAYEKARAEVLGDE